MGGEGGMGDVSKLYRLPENPGWCTGLVLTTFDPMASLPCVCVCACIIVCIRLSVDWVGANSIITSIECAQDN